MLGIGLMSGTSLDGIDAALVEIETPAQPVIRLKQFTTTAFSQELRQKIKQACDPTTSSVPLICQLNVELGYAFLAACRQVCQEANVAENTIDFVASHGQTIWHAPSDNPLISSTLQIGEPSIIAYGLGTPVVADFRVMDMAAGGQGAPLVPYTDYLLYRSPDKTRLLQNIGGIGNVTVLPKNGTLIDLIAFDTGPGNMIIDELMHQLFQLPYDAEGKIAQQGTIIPKLQRQLRNHSYFDQAPPKSTGRELFGEAFTDQLLADYSAEKPVDLVATVTDFTAYSIADSYRRFVFPKISGPIEVILAGGGAHNSTLKKMLVNYLPAEIKVVTQEDLGWSNDAKEAMAFALLGYETLHGHKNNAPAATGAKQSVILGKIIPNPFGDMKLPENQGAPF
jgi:anhydro-N-acetylmuramic acid kinase